MGTRKFEVDYCARKKLMDDTDGGCIEVVLLVLFGAAVSLVVVRCFVALWWHHLKVRHLRYQPWRKR